MSTAQISSATFSESETITEAVVSSGQLPRYVIKRDGRKEAFHAEKIARAIQASILGAGIEADSTRFVIAVVSVTQLIYMSEVGGLILGTKIPLKFLDLVIIFLMRTIISLPIAALVAHILF